MMITTVDIEMNQAIIRTSYIHSSLRGVLLLRFVTVVITYDNEGDTDLYVN